MFSSNCVVSMKQAKVEGESTAGTLATNGGGKVGHGILYLPEFGCGVHVSVKNCCASSEKISKLTDETFKEMMKELGCNQTKDVKVRMDLAKVIAEEKGTFKGMDWYNKAYRSEDALWCAATKVKDSYFSFECEK